MGEHFPAWGADALAGVDGDDHALAAEFLRRLPDELGAGDGGGVDRALVGAGEQQAANVFGSADAAADGERQEDALSGAGDDVEDGVALLVAGGDVEKGKLVGAGGVIKRGLLDRIAGVTQGDEVDALDDAAVLHVEAGNDPQLEQTLFASRGEA